MSGFPAMGRIFFLGMPFDPPRAGIMAIIDWLDAVACPCLFSSHISSQPVVKEKDQATASLADRKSLK
jgi:hypothetical protein